MSYSSEVLADSPLAFWHLDETTGTNLADSSGNSRDMTASSGAGGLTLGVAGQVGTAVGGKSGRTDTHAKITGASWMNTSSWTVEAWVNRGSSSTYGYVFTREAGPGQNVSTDYIWSLRVDSGGHAAIVVFKAGSAVFVTAAGTLSTNTWYHLAATLSGSTVTLYVNGVSVGSNSAGGALSTSSATDMVLLNARTTAGGDLNSQGDANYKADEVAFYGTALTSTRLLAHYNAGIAVPGVDGVVAPSLPPLTASAAGTVALPPVTGVAAAALPALTASAAGTATPPTSTGVVAATLPPLTGSAAGTYTPSTVTGVVVPSLPALTGSAAGTHTSNDQSGELAATLPALTGSAAGDYAPPVTTGVVAPTLPALTGSTAGGILNPVTGTLAATLPALTAVVEMGSDRTGVVAGTLPALSASITGLVDGGFEPPADDELGGPDIEDDGDLAPLALPPAGFVERPIWRRSVIVPDLSAYPKDPVTGQPHVTDAEYEAFEVIEEEVGVPHVIFPDNDNVNDMTYYRGMPIQGLRYLKREPLGDCDADVTIPGITSMDVHPDDVGAPAPFTRARANMELVMRKSDGTMRRLWSGNVFTRRLGNDGRQPTMALHALGSLYMADQPRVRPVVSNVPLDCGYLIHRALGLVTAKRYVTPPTVATGILSNERGAWSTSPLGFVTDLLAKMWTDDGNQWTLAKILGSRRAYETRLKKTEPEWTITNGARGVYPDIEEDDNGRNIVFGYGTNPDGGFWQNTKYPDNGGVTRLPLAADSRTQLWLYDDKGNITGENPDFDGNVMPREANVDMGQNTKATGIRAAQQIVDRESVPSFVGRITLETDPREGWRGFINEGDKITLIGYEGRDLVLHVSDVDVDLDNPTLPVTLTVDERSRDAMTVAEISTRDHEARRDPALTPGNPNRRSRLEIDQIVPFDSESPAGRIPSSFAAGGQWTVISVPFATAGRIAKVHFDTGSPMAAGLFAYRPSVGTLNSLIGNPLTQDDPLKAHMNTLENTYGLCAFWGQKGQRMGYSPGREDASDPFTGDFDEATGFDYVAQANARLYLAVYAAASTTVSGRCFPALVV